MTILGLGPIWMSDNEEIKKKTAKLLEDGGIFAFGLSEKEHGADLYSSEMALTPLGDGKYVADGGKYYIGNANKAALVSTFGKDTETDDYVFFAVDSQHEKSGPGHHPQQRAEYADRKPVPVDLHAHNAQEPVNVILNGSVDALV